MKPLASILLAALTVIAPALRAQTAPPATCPPTVTLDQLITAIDDAVSGPADKDRTCLRDVMLPEARLIPVSKHPDGTIAPRILSLNEYIDAVRERGSEVFYERQIKVKSETYGPIAHLWSTYEVRPTPDGKAEMRGINSIQAVFDGQRWRVIEIAWHAETPADPVPAQYLP
ncbi:MAG TPA: hypothetical protein VME23_14845 [Terracidiphilus sp.]|nr:hypothetical protein [Terracidiphilus sp.]